MDNDKDNSNETQADQSLLASELKLGCYDVLIGPAVNGVITMIGCKLFVGVVDDLDALKQYYAGILPDEFKKFTSRDDAFNTGMEREMTDDVSAAISECAVTTCPQFINNMLEAKEHRRQLMYIIKAANGWILVKDGNAYVAKTKMQLLPLIN